MTISEIMQSQNMSKYRLAKDCDTWADTRALLDTLLLQGDVSHE